MTKQNDLLSDIERYMNTESAIKRMISATNSRLVAVEMLTDPFLERFGYDVKNDPIKQKIGKIAREIMENHGYIIDRQMVRTRDKRLFASGTRYKKGK